MTAPRIPRSGDAHIPAWPRIRIVPLPLRRPPDAATPPQTPARSGDASSHPRLNAALQAARADGHATGYQRGYMHGVRWGLICGACSMFAAGVLIAAIVAGLGAKA